MVGGTGDAQARLVLSCILFFSLFWKLQVLPEKNVNSLPLQIDTLYVV